MVATLPPRAAEDAPAPRSADRVAHAADAGTLEIDASAALLGKDLVQDGEIIILMLRPSLWFVTLSSLGGLVMIEIFTFALAYVSQMPWAAWNDTQAFAIGAGLVALRLGWQFLEWLSRVYILTDRRIITRSGMLRVAVFEAPLKNIQHTSVFAEVRERLCGLGTLGFATAGSDTFDAFWVMIRQPFVVHRTVVETIRRYGR